MAFCPNCGKELADGAVCDCQTNNNSVEFAPAQKKGNKGFLAIGGIAVVAVIILVLLFSSLSGGYKEPINQLIDGINHSDFDEVFSAVVPDKKLKEVKKELKKQDEDWDDVIDELNDNFDDVIEKLEKGYGKNIKFSVKFVDKKKVDDDEFEDIEEYFNDEFDAEIKKAYKVKTEITIKGKKDKDSTTSWMYVAKVKGDDWKVSTYNDESGITDMFGSSLF